MIPSSRRVAGVVVIAVLILAMGAQAALAVVYIYTGRGFGPARLGYRDSVNVTALKPVIGAVKWYGRDTSYTNQVVYLNKFGRRLSNGKYPLEMYSDKYHKTFSFIINSSSYPTTTGIRVGTAESTLKSKYGTALKRYPGSVYTRYTIGSTPYTDFYVRYSKVQKIVVRSR